MDGVGKWRWIEGDVEKGRVKRRGVRRRKGGVETKAWMERVVEDGMEGIRHG